MNREDLLNTLNKATANATDVFFDLYTEYLENGEEPEEALQIILEYPKIIGDSEDKNPLTIQRPDERKITLMFEDLICGTANRIAEMNPEQKDFYKKLYKIIFLSDSDLYPKSKEEKVIALKILSETAADVPYFQITKTDPISKEEFALAMDTLHPQICEVLSMLRRSFPTVHERTAQILRIADSISDSKKRIIFWNFVIHQLQNNDD